MRKNTIFNQDCLKTMKRMEDSSGDIIYDPFMGSGTTAVVAKKLERFFIGSEISKKYVEFAQKRLKAVNKKRL